MSTKITKHEVVQNLNAGRIAPIAACRQLRKMGRMSNSLARAEQRKLYNFDQTPLEQIEVKDMAAYAALLTKAVANGASIDRPKSKPKAKAVNKPKPVRPLSPETKAKVAAQKATKAFAGAEQRLQQKYAPTLQDRIGGCFNAIKNSFKIS